MREVQRDAEGEVLTVPVAFGEAGGQTVLPIYVTPRAGRTEIAGERAGALWVRLAAPPVRERPTRR